MIEPAPTSVHPPGTVGYQGSPGAFGEGAIRARWGDAVEAVPLPTFTEVLCALVEGTVDCAAIPVWNSTIGPIEPARAAIAAVVGRVRVVDEVEIPVRHALLALAGATLGTIRYVGSHPAALAQCARFFAAHPALSPVVASDTAGAALELGRWATSRPHIGRPTARGAWFSALDFSAPFELAAIAPREVAARAGLTVLAEAIQDAPDNRTRFEFFGRA